MSKVNDTRTNILNAAQDMVQRQSISGVSFQELAKRVGIKKGSLYYHFESKDALAIAMLERVTTEMKDSFKRGEGKSPSDRLNYFLNIYLNHIVPSKKLCPGGAFAGEWDKLSEPVQTQVKRLIEAQVIGIQNIIGEGLRNGAFIQHGKSIEELAQWVLACVQGALITSRVSGSKSSFESTLEIINQYLGGTKKVE